MKKNPRKTTIPIICTITATITLACQLTLQNPIISEPTIPEPIQTTATTATPGTTTEAQEEQLALTPPVAPRVDTQILGEEYTPVSTLTSTSTPKSILIYTQPQSPVYLVNFLYPKLGCQWIGVAGQIFNTSGAPVNGLVIEISGTLDGKDFLALGLTGTSLLIGPGGFEIKLADQPFDSHNALNLRVFDQNGNQLSETLPITTYNDCRKNLILINFILLNQSLKEKIFFPTIFR